MSLPVHSALLLFVLAAVGCSLAAARPLEFVSDPQATGINSLADILQLLMERHPGLEIRVEFEEDDRKETPAASTTERTAAAAIAPIATRANAGLVAKLTKNADKLEDVLQRLAKLEAALAAQIRRQAEPVGANQIEVASGEEDDEDAEIKSLLAAH
ncbi:hypothetical protein M3Y99_01436400 [Aphelenchoides fujianensis]|nr:hypothetical protein M3Y99_01436400 [Aphelenchoides fujianensis]